MWSIHTKDYYSATVRKESMSRATSWMTLEDITLKEISQSSKDKKVHFHASVVSKVVTLIEI